MPSEGSVAPRERINIRYKPDTNMPEEKELPLKLLMLGDFAGRKVETPVEERETIAIDKNTFNDVLSEMKVSVNLQVKDTLSGKEDEMKAFKHNIKSMKDFSPEAIVESDPQLKELLELRKTLVTLKGPLGNLKNFRKWLEEKTKKKEDAEKILNSIRKRTGTPGAQA
jgi:type VI secretion system protein ImpB